MVSFPSKKLVLATLAVLALAIALRFKENAQYVHSIFRRQSAAPAAPQIPQQCINSGKIVLNFHEGPTEAYTPPILKMLKDKGVKANFFVTSIGMNIAKNVEIAKSVMSDGHVIGLRVVTSGNVDGLSQAELVNFIATQVSVVFSSLGVIPRFLIFDYGTVNDKTAQFINSLGYVAVGYKIDGNVYYACEMPLEADPEMRTRLEDVLKANAQSSLKTSAIILLNDRCNQASGVSGMIDVAAKYSYSVAQISECLGYAPGPLGAYLPKIPCLDPAKCPDPPAMSTSTVAYTSVQTVATVTVSVTATLSMAPETTATILKVVQTTMCPTPEDDGNHMHSHLWTRKIAPTGTMPTILYTRAPDQPNANWLYADDDELATTTYLSYLSTASLWVTYTGASVPAGSWENQDAVYARGLAQKAYRNEKYVVATATLQGVAGPTGVSVSVSGGSSSSAAGASSTTTSSTKIVAPTAGVKVSGAPRSVAALSPGVVLFVALFSGIFALFN